MYSEEITKELVKSLKRLGIEVPAEEIMLEHPATLEHGDFSSNFALMAAKRLGRKPREIAEEIVAAWEKEGLPQTVEKVAVAGPGFINIWLKLELLGKQLSQVISKREDFGKSEQGKGKTVVIDYSAPNIAKPFGIGHLRSTDIGQAVYNLYQKAGWKVIGDNHLGDWGTQFGKLIYEIKKYKKEEISRLTIADLERLYVLFHQEVVEQPEMEEEAREWFKKLEEGDREAREIWQAVVEISLKEFDRIYRLLGVKIDKALGESFYQDKMQAVLEDARKKGILKESQGAMVVEIPGMEVPALLVKSNGTTIYFLRDLATIKYRNETWSPDLIVYEVGADQAFHFQQLFAVAQMLGYGGPEKFVHLAHGLIRWPTGKFSTRRGATIHLEEVLNEAIAGARKLMETAGVAKQLPEEEKQKTAEAIGIGAIKYNDLKQNPKTDIIFDWHQILTLAGNSGPYIQYTYARTQSVLRKADFSFKEAKEVAGFEKQKLSSEEEVLLRSFYCFPEVVIEAGESLAPNLLCNFLFDLSQKFNLFYDREKIIGSSTEEFRLLLTAAVGQVLENGLSLLGIEALERM